MSLVLPREEEVEKMFSRILASRDACERLSETFYNHLCDDNRFIDSDPGHFAEVMLKAVIYYDEPWTLAVDCVAYLRKLWRCIRIFCYVQQSMETCCCGWNNRSCI